MWNKSTSMNDLKTTYTDTHPVNVDHGIMYGSLDVSSSSRFDERLEAVGYKFRGFFRPPYSGNFYVVVRSDDASEFWISTSSSTSDLVSTILSFIEFVEISHKKEITLYDVFFSVNFCQSPSSRPI